jgi:hypothetical protein
MRRNEVEEFKRYCRENAEALIVLRGKRGRRLRNITLHRCLTRRLETKDQQAMLHGAKDEH